MKKVKHNLKRPYVFVLTFIGGSIVHNAIYAIFNVEEPFFFFVSILSAPVFIVSVIYTAVFYIKTRRRSL